MIDLILAVVSSMLVSVIMRVSEKHIHNNISMLASNYLMCTVMAVICAGTWNLFPGVCGRLFIQRGAGTH